MSVQPGYIWLMFKVIMENCPPRKLPSCNYVGWKNALLALVYILGKTLENKGEKLKTHLQKMVYINLL